MAVTIHTPLRARLAERLREATDPEAVAAVVFAEVGRDIPNVLACLATVDPTSGLITRALKSRPLEIGDHEFTAAEYGEADVNQFTELHERPIPVGVLSIDTAGRPEMCRRFRDFMAPRFGFTDELRGACRVGGTMWGALALYRGSGDPPFCTAEADVLASVHEIIGRALMQALVAPTGEADGGASASTVLVLDEGDRIESRSGPVEALVETLGGWDGGQLPASLLAAAASARTSGGSVGSQVRTRDGRILTVRAVPVSSLAGIRSVVLTVETPSTAVVGRLRLAARGLTAREREVVEQVLIGASTKEMASSLHLSAHTVQDHLKAVFAKLGVSSRRELIAQFVG